MGNKLGKAAGPGGDGGMVDSAKFESFQQVRIREAAEMKNPGKPRPEEHLMGKTGIVETRGLVYGSGPAEERYLLPAYFVRIEGIGPVLVGEDWLEVAASND